MNSRSKAPRTYARSPSRLPVRSLSFKVLSGNEGFVGYGAVFEADGVVVDNYSVRSNNGQAMFWTNPSVNAQMNALLGYDLVILQYGLNIMQTGVSNLHQLRRPDREDGGLRPPVLPDRRRAGAGRQRPFGEDRRRFEPMDAIPTCSATSGRRREHRSGLLAYLRRHAFAGRHGTVRRQRWAGKDFTHINYAGGRRGVVALRRPQRRAFRAYAGEAARIRRQAEQAVLDSLRRRRIERDLIPAFRRNLNAPLK